MTEIAFVVPGRLNQLTGGYLFDRRIVEGLRARGRQVRVIELSTRDPSANGAVLASLADGTRTVVDGLALANLADTVVAQARRLRLIAFVHGPLAQETSLLPAAAKRAAAREAALLSLVCGVLCPSRSTAAAVEGYGITRERIAIVPPGTESRPAHWGRGASRCGRCSVWRTSSPAKATSFSSRRWLEFATSIGASAVSDRSNAIRQRHGLSAVGFGPPGLAGASPCPANVRRKA